MLLVVFMYSNNDYSKIIQKVLLTGGNRKHKNALKEYPIFRHFHINIESGEIIKGLM